jgi:hypothetical protein
VSHAAVPQIPPTTMLAATSTGHDVRLVVAAVAGIAVLVALVPC